MSALMKKHPTESVAKPKNQTILHLVHNGYVYNIPRSVAEKYRESKETSKNKISSNKVFSDIENKYTKAGVLLKGTRYREGLTQAEMAKKIKITQADLSKMENGKRPIGKIIAKRIEKMFDVNYRYFLE